MCFDPAMYNAVLKEASQQGLFVAAGYGAAGQGCAELFEVFEGDLLEVHQGLAFDPREELLPDCEVLIVVGAFADTLGLLVLEEFLDC